LHEAIASHPQLGAIAVIHCVGPDAGAPCAAAAPAARALGGHGGGTGHGQSRQLVDAGDIVLVKGSKGIKVSLVVDALRKLGQAVAHDHQGTE
jgi:UDP-N-acetylmuramoyl-tripeptide--D-alanyl-D-alanine ligase